jgi:hypothetical protein
VILKRQKVESNLNNGILLVEVRDGVTPSSYYMRTSEELDTVRQETAKKLIAEYPLSQKQTQGILIFWGK